MRSASTLCSRAISSTTSGAAVETRIRDGPSWNNANSGRRSARDLNRRADAVPAQHSASATARPPSLTSCADSAWPSLTISRIAVLHAFFVIHIERRRQSPHFVQDDLGVLRAAEARGVARAEPAQQHHRAAFVLERNRHRRRRSSSTRRCPSPASARSPRPAFRCTG